MSRADPTSRHWRSPPSRPQVSLAAPLREVQHSRFRERLAWSDRARYPRKPAASRASFLLRKYWITTIFPSRQVSTWA
jgi:hypothetical protein